jgi:hypothetical protein
MMFWEAANPVAEIFRRLQVYLGVPQTGKWDEATHNALSARLVSLGAANMALPAWGAPKTQWTAEQQALFAKLDSAFGSGIALSLPRLPSSGPIGPVEDPQLPPIAERADTVYRTEVVRLLGAVGLPTDDWANLRAVVDPAATKIASVMGDAMAAVYKAEVDAATPWYAKPSTWLIVGGVVVVGGGLLWWKMSRSTP